MNNWGVVAGCSIDNMEALPITILETIRRTVRAVMHGHRSAREQDIEDICSETVVWLLSYPEGKIQDQQALASTLARRACSAWMRQRYPAFHRLRLRLRYLLKTEKDFALWPQSAQEWVCGLLAMRGKPAGQLSNSIAVTEPESAVAAVLRRLFRAHAWPLFFYEVAQFCARQWNINDETADVEESTAVVEAATPVERMHHNDLLRRMWAEVKECPPRQRAALLLNLRLEGGECGISCFVAEGVATMEEIAAAVEMNATHFARLWGRLPLEDVEIARMLHCTRQQVINLRKSIRERLRNRMQKDAGNMSAVSPTGRSKKR